MKIRTAIINAAVIIAMPLVMASTCDKGAGIVCPTPKHYSQAFLDELDRELTMIEGRAPNVVTMLRDYDVTLAAIRTCIRLKRKHR